MPMMDVYGTTTTFNDKNLLSQDIVGAVMRWDAGPKIPLFAENTAAFIHHRPAKAISTASQRGDVRLQVLTPTGVHNRDKQLGVVKELTEIVAQSAGD